MSGPHAKPAQAFVHLHAQSAYSLLESALPLQKLIDLAISDGQPALAVTDRNNLFGALEFSEKAFSKGLQPIMGIKIAVNFDDHDENPSNNRKPAMETLPSIVLLAMNENGYQNLIKLGSLAHIEAVPQTEETPEDPDSTVVSIAKGTPLDNNRHAHLGPHITLEALQTFSADMICLTGGGEGPINLALKQSHSDQAASRLGLLQSIFKDRLYVEIQRHGTRDDPREGVIENPLLELAYANQLPIVATNQPLFPTRDDFMAHDALICIAEGVVIGAEDRKSYTEEYFFKSSSEMISLFSDLPEAIENTVEIAQRCAFRSPMRDPILPRFAAQPGEDAEKALKAEANLLRQQSIDGLEERMKHFEPAGDYTRKDYDDRLDYELGIIEQMGFPGYFLIVADFIKWAKNHGIPVGPGRGSGAGSLVAWALTITDIDPMRFSLLFERFLNPERVSMPDFDIDFCQDRREEVIHYVQAKYGREQVAQIITFGTLQARAVLRDVGRVLQMPYGQVDRITKMVPANPANPVTLKQAIEQEPRLQEARKSEENVDRLFDIALRLEGLYRHASTHAAGIVIGDRKLDELVPLYRDPRSEMPVTQFNMKWVEPAGLVKFDFLGLKTLTVLEKAVEFVAARDRSQKKIELLAVPLDDGPTFEMLTKGETVGVFQLESMGMRKALIGMKPDQFEDIIALVALYRPGPMENIPVYNARKNGEEEIESIHPKIDHLVSETQGVIVYQEQVMQIAQELAGYSLGAADLLRRAMGKKIRAEMDKQRGIFVKGAIENGLKENRANAIFDLLAKFADYGFNKSHAAAYALVSYHTAYMKANYPVEFLAASMQLDMGNTDKLAIFRQEANNLGIEIVPPSVQTSFAHFSVKDSKIFYALAALKGVGESAVSQIIADREQNGVFADLSDFFGRIDIRQVNKRTIESLICAGALDCFGHTREQLLAGMERLMGYASRVANDRETGQNDMFGAASGETEKIDLPTIKPWQPSEKLQREFQAMGFYLSAHPLDEYRQLMIKTRVQMYGEFEDSVRAGATAGRLAGTVTGRQERKTRTGKRMGIITLSDPSGQYEAVIFEEGLGRFRDMLEPGKSVILLAGAEQREEGISIRIQSVESLEAEASRVTQNLRIFLRDEKPVPGISSMLSGKSAPPRGNSKVSVIVIQGNGEMEVEVTLREKFKMTPQFANAIKSVPGVLQVELV
ncbi:MAG: DNA polymerase III subunit alpha [Salaquimonas sp.]